MSKGGGAAASRRSILATAAVCVFTGSLLFGFFYVLLGRVERDLSSARWRAAQEARSREEDQAKHTEEIRGLLNKTYRAFAIMGPPLLLIPLFSRRLISWLQPDYIEAAVVFSILFVSILFTLAMLPVRSVLYSIHRPQVETAIQAGALLFTATAGFFLIRSHGALGAAVAMLLQRFLSAAAMLTFVYLYIYRGTGPSEPGPDGSAD